MQAPIDRIPWAIVFRALLPFALGYFMSYLFRAVNQVIAPDLIAELQLSPSELGLLTAAYLFGFTLFQLPLGLLLDRFGPRRVQTTLLLVSAGGAALFALAPDPWSLTVARGILGLGLCGCLMSAFKANVMWLPMSRVALANQSGPSCCSSSGACFASRRICAAAVRRPALPATADNRSRVTTQRVRRIAIGLTSTRSS